jgi:hypothetical protein
MKMGVATVVAALLMAAPTSLAWPGRPAAPPPTSPNPGGPPPAWIETQSTSTWLAYGSYCWTGVGKATCVDMIPPQIRPDLPVFTVKRGGTVRVHLGFTPSTVGVSLGGRSIRVTRNGAKRVVSWAATRSGILNVFARTKTGDASYVARLRLR